MRPRRGGALLSTRGLTQRVPRGLQWAFDAFDPRHMPLDEMTAPYTITNLISFMELSSSVTHDLVVIVALRSSTNKHQETHLGPMSDYIAMAYHGNETVDGIIPTVGLARSQILGKPGANNTLPQHYSVRARLHNQSVHLTCLGTNTGLYPPGGAFIGTVPMLEIGSTSGPDYEAQTIKQSFADDAMTVGYLKEVSATDLLRGFTLSSAVAENSVYRRWNDFEVPPVTTDRGSLGITTGLEPIVIYIPKVGAGTTVVNYRLNIAQQWCSRHPHNIMLRATQKQHEPTNSNVFNQAVSQVKDIAHVAADSAGFALASGLASAGAGALRGLVNAPPAYAPMIAAVWA
jgi:hypothetical protein